jgi:hypothetical protein
MVKDVTRLLFSRIGVEVSRIPVADYVQNIRIYLSIK